MPRAATTDNLLSIADISRHFSLPESTTRYYLKRFAAYIPSVGEGRRRRFRQETLDIITAILDEMKQSRTAQAVEEALAVRFPRNAVAVAPSQECGQAAGPAMVQGMAPQVLINILERQTQALELIAQAFPLLAERLQQLQPAPSAQGGQAALAEGGAHHDAAALRRDLDNLKLLLEASEKTQQADLEQLRTWMGRVIQRKGENAYDAF